MNIFEAGGVSWHAAPFALMDRSIELLVTSSLGAVPTGCNSGVTSPASLFVF
jgi:hypothetical protein